MAQFHGKGMHDPGFLRMKYLYIMGNRKILLQMDPSRDCVARPSRVKSTGIMCAKLTRALPLLFNEPCQLLQLSSSSTGATTTSNASATVQALVGLALAYALYNIR